MAISLTHILNFVLLSTFSVISYGEISGWCSESKPYQKIEEKITHLHFYIHDTFSGSKPSAVQIAGPEGLGLSFGALVVVDDPLTVGPEITSKLVGRAQGIYSMADQNVLSLVMSLSFVFTEGKLNGSTISVLTRNPITHPNREIAIVGGTGVFRLARGYVKLHTVFFQQKDAIVEYNVTVIHY